MEETEKVEFDYEEGYKKVKEENKELKELLSDMTGALADATIRIVDNKIEITRLKRKRLPSFADCIFAGLSMYCVAKVTYEWIRKLI